MQHSTTPSLTGAPGAGARQRQRAAALLLAAGAAALPAHADAQETARSACHLDVRSGGGYETNPRFVANGSGAAYGQLAAGGDVRRESARTTLAAVASGSLTRYERFATLNRYGYLFGADAAHLLTPRFTTRASARFVSSLSHGGSADAAGLFLLPLSLTRSRQASASISYRLSPRAALEAGANHDDVAFENSLLAGGSLLSTHAALTRRYATNGDVGLRYEFDRNSVRGGTVDEHALSVSWQQVRAHGAARLSAGVARLDAADRSAASWRAIGDAMFGQRAGAGMLGLRYARSVSQLYGLGGVVASDIASADYGIVSRRGSRCLIEVHRAWLTEPSLGVIPSRRVMTSGSSLLLDRRLGRTVGVEARLFAARSNAIVSIPTRGLSLGLTYRL